MDIRGKSLNIRVQYNGKIRDKKGQRSLVITK